MNSTISEFDVTFTCYVAIFGDTNIFISMVWKDKKRQLTMDSPSLLHELPSCPGFRLLPLLLLLPYRGHHPYHHPFGHHLHRDHLEILLMENESSIWEPNTQLVCKQLSETSRQNCHTCKMSSKWTPTIQKIQNSNKSLPHQAKF